MKREAVLEAKMQALEQIKRHYESDSYETLFQSILARRPEQRIAVGYSRLSEQDYQLELRVQREDQQGYHLAEKIKAEVKDEAAIEVIHKIEIPPNTARADEKTSLPSVEKGKGKLEIGMSIGHEEGGAGTLGAFLSRSDGVFILSCNHVMALLGRAKLDDVIIHPGLDDTIKREDINPVAHLKDFAPIRENFPNEIDAAVARILPDWVHDTTRVPVGRGYPNEGTAIRPFQEIDELAWRGKKVAKIGRTTGYTRGQINAVEFELLSVNAPPGPKLLFHKVIEVRSENSEQAFSQDGDSGSLVFTEDDYQAVGLVFAGGRRAPDGTFISYVCRIDKILSWANAELLTETD